MTATTHRARSSTAAASRRSSRPASRGSTTSLRSTKSRSQTSADDIQSRYPSVQEDGPSAYHDHLTYPDDRFARDSFDVGGTSDYHLDPAIHPQPDVRRYDRHDPIHTLQQAHAQGFAQAYDIAPALDSPNPFATGGGMPASGTEGEDKKKKGAGPSPNELEMLDLLAKHKHRSLRDVAGEVLATERTPRGEKTKTLFAMLWLSQVCMISKSASVPKNRVYSRYATRCGTERVPPLNPASFGKAVRYVFPNIPTRRLGVRGESKYHYVDLALLDEPAEEATGNAFAAQANGGRQRYTPTHVASFSATRFPTETAVFPAPDGSFEHAATAFGDAGHSHAGVFSHSATPGFYTGGQTAQMYHQPLRFPSRSDASLQEDEPLELPNVWHYAPAKTDVDAASALSALYFTHCTSLIDSVRFCKERAFFHLFSSFNGTLTVPVQKLFSHPAMASWIKECDWMMYQRMTQNLSRLALQAVPTAALHFLDSVSKRLHAHITKTFENHPLHVLEAKLEPATLFANVVQRMLRANSSAHAAAALLTDDAHRDSMWYDWVKYVDPKRIMESELPNCGYEEAYKVLTQDVRTLLRPRHTSRLLEHGTHYQAASMMASANPEHDASSETAIERIAAFLLTLSARFPRASTRTILHCVSSLGTAALREITVENGQSYNLWWITKVFIDELGLWYAFQGGFLDHRPPQLSPFEGEMSLMDAEDGEMDLSGTQDFGNAMHADAFSGRFAGDKRASFAPNGASTMPLEEHDDSGIGMSLLDDGHSVPPKYESRVLATGTA